jgi:acyl carrier protein
MSEGQTAARSRGVCATCGVSAIQDSKFCNKCDCTRRLQRCFRQGLALPPNCDVSSADSSTLAQWDSVAHLQLVVAIEDEFGIELGPGDVIGLQSYTGAVAILRRHGVWIDT